VDVSGASVPNTTVKVLNKDTGFTRTELTGPDGAFTFPALPVGTYRLTAEKAGFSTYVQEGITLTVNRTATQRVLLQVGTATQEVTVVANADMVTTQTATIGQLVNQNQVTDLPLNGRGAQGLVLIAVGTADNTRVSGILGQGGIYGGNLYSSEQMAGVNGGGTGNVNYQMDGAGHNDTYVNMNLPFPNPDALQEFNLQTSSMSAQYGGGAAVVNIVTKSGTNALHGSAFEFLRNGNMNARNFFAPTQDSLKRNQYGATIGGPIKKDQLFFFGTYQGTRIRTTPAGVIAFVPTPAERTGDFSGTAQLVDPATRTPFPGNQIPVNQFSGPSKYFLPKIPLPNGPGEQVTFLGPASRPNDDQFMPKIDCVRGNHRVSGRYFYTKFNSPTDFSQVKQNLLAMDRNGNEVRIQTLALDHVYSASPTLLFQTWFGFDSQVGGSRSGIPAGSDITFPAAGVKIEGGAKGIPPAIEGLNVTGFFSAASTHFGDFNRGDWTLRESVTKIKGRHQLIFGGEIVRLIQDITNSNTQSGSFTFGPPLWLQPCRLSAGRGQHFYSRRRAIPEHAREQIQPVCAGQLESDTKTDAEPRPSVGAVVSLHRALQPGAVLCAGTEIGGIHERARGHHLRRRPRMPGGQGCCQRAAQRRSAGRLCLQHRPEVGSPWRRWTLLHDSPEPDFQWAKRRGAVPAQVSVDRQYSL
jgi:hypothetical protein